MKYKLLISFLLLVRIFPVCSQEVFNKLAAKQIVDEYKAYLYNGVSKWTVYKTKGKSFDKSRDQANIYGFIINDGFQVVYLGVNGKNDTLKIRIDTTSNELDYNFLYNEGTKHRIKYKNYARILESHTIDGKVSDSLTIEYKNDSTIFRFYENSTLTDIRLDLNQNDTVISVFLRKNNIIDTFKVSYYYESGEYTYETSESPRGKAISIVKLDSKNRVIQDSYYDEYERKVVDVYYYFRNSSFVQKNYHQKSKKYSAKTISHEIETYEYSDSFLLNRYSVWRKGKGEENFVIQYEY